MAMKFGVHDSGKLELMSVRVYCIGCITVKNVFYVLILCTVKCVESVSYTHLDVYKRQASVDPLRVTTRAYTCVMRTDT